MTPYMRKEMIFGVLTMAGGALAIRSGYLRAVSACFPYEVWAVGGLPDIFRYVVKGESKYL